MKQTRRLKSRQSSDISPDHSDTEDDEQSNRKKQIMKTRRSNDYSISHSTSEEKIHGKAKNKSSSRRSRNSSASTTDTEFNDNDHSSASAVSDDFVTNWYSTTDDEQESEQDQGNEKKIQMILAHRIISEDSENPEYEFLVKYVGKSYKNSQWVQKHEINNVMLKHYLKRNKAPQSPPYYDPEYDKIDYIVGKKDDTYLVKWKGLDYDNLTYETADSINLINKSLIPQFEKLNKRPTIEELFLPPHPKASEWKPLATHKPSKKGLQLKPYQLKGLNFLINSWYCKKNAILADEMGLGKTCQTCVFINYLQSVQKIKGPFLIVVPLSTISHWERELADWTNNDKHRVLTYYGIKERRKYQKMYEMFYPDTDIPKFNILVTTYQFVIKDATLFSSIHWRCVVIDEAHRLKNHESKLINCFRQFEIDFKLLLTGTPLQNNIEELWTLLNFLNPEAFESLKDFENKFGELTESDQVVQLQSILEPLMLRRRKNDVENSIVPLEEIIIECPMTQHQKAYYKSIFTRNLEYLSRGAHKDNTTNLINISMELRKVCNHPYLLKGAEDQILVELRDSLGGAVSDENRFVNDALIRSAGKMILLDKLLKKLKEDGHRVLIFSQMTKMLDILQDYLTYRNYKFERLDGNVRGDLRQASIDKFNEPNSPDFVFLLCTKAGGVGINLTSADTVIIYDSDWNPQNDLQATARCHRIGQTKEVKMYRFITAKSYERKMFETASIKLGLDQALLDQQNKKQRKEELEKLLKLGAYHAFEDEENEMDKFNENEDIDVVLSRSQKIKHENIGNSSKFSFTQFELDESDSQIDVTAPDFWQKYLPDVKEDDLSLDGVSIGERRRILREGTEGIEGGGNASSEYAESGDWNKKKLNKIMSNFMKFGWGRWKVIYENSEVSFPLTDIKEACIVLLGWMIKASDERFPVLESIYSHSRTNETKEFENIFRSYNDTKTSCSSSASKKLSRLDLLYFLNGAIGTCPNPPDEIIVPDILNQKPAEWWTEKDDQLLLYGAWQNGYMNYTDIKFSNPDEQINMSVLTVRLRNLIAGLKNAYMKYKEKVGDANLPFNYETLKASQGDISKRDHKVIIHYLNYFGYPDVESFKKVANLMSKSDELLDNYIQTIIRYCKKGNGEDEKKLADKISRPDKLLQQIELFKAIREKKDSDDFTMDDQELLEYISQNGLIGLNNKEFITSRFKTDNVETSVRKYLKKLFIHKISGPRSSGSRGNSSTLHNYAIPDYEKNPDGSPKLPIRISQIMIIKDLGKVVYDRPNYHTERYIYPVGYEAERMFTSIDDPNDKVWYVEQIMDGGDNPIFRVEMKDDPKGRVFEGNAPSKPWTDIVKYIENRKKKLKIGASRCTTISGPEMYGIYSPLGSYLVQNLENADKCTRFMKRKFKNDNANTDDNNESDNEEGDNESEKESESNDEKAVSSKSSKNREKKSIISTRSRSSSKEKNNDDTENNEFSMIKSRPQRRAAVRAQEKLEVFFDFSDIADQSNNDLEFLSVSVPANEILQRDRLDIPVPYAKNPLKTAVKRMALQVGDSY